MGAHHVVRHWIQRIAVAAVSLSAGVATLPVKAQPASIGLFEIARFNLDSTANSANPEFIGSNPVAVGWNGSKLFVAGLNASGTTATTSIIEITNAANASGFVTPTYSSRFGSISAPNLRGYTGLAMSGNQLAASFDPGSNTPSGYQMFNATDNSLVWNLTASGTTTGNIGTTRGYAGPAFDPGFQGNAAQGGGLAWVTQGQGRRFLNDAATGASIYTTTANVPAGAQQGMIINTNPITTNWRDIAFDPATGDMYTRTNNQVTRTNRTGANSTISLTGTAGQSSIIVPLGTSNEVGTNVGFVNGVLSSDFNPFVGDLLIFNNRASGALGQSWTDAIQLSTTLGDPITPVWTFLQAPSTGVSLYDFAWDSSSQTLAVLDYSNRNVSIFSTAVPEPSTWAMLATGATACGWAVTWRKRRRKQLAAAADTATA